MMGKKSGVAIRIKNEVNKNALAVHCNGHSLNLACGGSIKNCKIMQDSLETSFEISKLIKKSPRLEAQWKNIQTDGTDNEENKSKAIRVFSITRWTVRHGALVSIIQHYKKLNELWCWCLEVYKDTETKARIIGVQTQMQKLIYFFGVEL